MIYMVMTNEQRSDLGDRQALSRDALDGTTTYVEHEQGAARIQNVA